MKKKKIDKTTELDNHKKFVEFLKKRIQSENYKNSVTPEEYQKTLQKYDKAKLKMKLMVW